MKKLLFTLALLIFGALGFIGSAEAQQVQWPPPAGTQAVLCYYNSALPTIVTANAGVAQCDSNGRLLVNIANTTIPTALNPCASTAVAKSTVAVNITSATTTQIVAVSSGKAVYVCGGTITIAPSATSADTAKLEYGTSTNCTGTNALSGTFGDGDLTSAAPPIVVDFPSGIATPASQGVCIVSAGTAVNIQGTVTYVQQ